MHEQSDENRHRSPETPESISHRSLISRRGFLLAGGAAGLSLAAYSGTHARHELETTRIDMPLRNLPDAFHGFRIVQISDIHLHEYTEDWYFEKVIDQVNALAPDLVVFTGDLVSRGPGPLTVAYRAAGVGAEIMSGLRAPQRFAILGNHDAQVGPRHVIDPLQDHGTPVLQDEAVAIERGNERIWLCGTKDVTWNRPDLAKTIPADPKAPVILLAHEPDFADYVARHPRGKLVDWMLSGHTHGGQVRLPLVGPVQLPVLGRKYVEGMFRFGSMQLYVNRGIGAVWMPFRLNCPSEITQFRLIRA